MGRSPSMTSFVETLVSISGKSLRQILNRVGDSMHPLPLAGRASTGLHQYFCHKSTLKLFQFQKHYCQYSHLFLSILPGGGLKRNHRKTTSTISPARLQSRILTQVYFWFFLLKYTQLLSVTPLKSANLIAQTWIKCRQ